MLKCAPLVFMLVMGCKFDPNTTKIQYMPDMADGPVAKTLRSYIDPPDNSVASNAILYPETPDEAEKIFRNPFVGVSDYKAHQKNGKHLYETFCSVCHGAQAKGKGTISDVYPQAADLTTEMYKKKKDGFFFYRISKGANIMKGYAHAIDPDERWDIVLHIRELQKM